MDIEVTDEDHLYILMMSVGKTREIDLRAKAFLDKYAKNMKLLMQQNVDLMELIMHA